MKKYTSMKVMTIVLIGLTFCILVVYSVFLIAYFQCDNRPATIEEMGSLGDTVAGLLNPVIAIANIGVLIYISYEIQKLATNSQERAITREIKLRFIREVRLDLEELIEKWRTDPTNDEKFDDLFKRFYSIRYMLPDEVKNANLYDTAEQTLMDLRNDYRSGLVGALDRKADDLKNKFNSVAWELELRIMDKSKDDDA